MPKPKVLLDTNIIVSGLVFLSGNEHKVLKLAEEKRIALVLPEFIVEETRMVLARIFAGHEALLDVFLAMVEHVSVPWETIRQLVPVYERFVRDKKDAPILASVVVAKPDYTVTGDRDLREDLKACSETAELTEPCSSGEFLRAFSKRPPASPLEDTP